ncbi:protein of unknown function [Nitrosomonas communis]|uniref:Protein NO VEIN C-terminal domain-containing protein n=1 Tax=Nitrosomonas communis TaxID=44574 RepID=A0A1I4S402_9PROT|nr:protein of unknown function [Nitrosomonas communis]
MDRKLLLYVAIDTIPLIRLSDGTHIIARENGKPKAFLPSAIQTGFPTMHKDVCTSAEARAFLISLGITEPDQVDDVVVNVLYKYKQDEFSINDKDYAYDIEKIIVAFSTDSKLQREKLLLALKETSFVMAVDAGTGSKLRVEPDKLYLATEHIKQLFAGIPNILIVDNSYECLKGEKLRDLLEACGALWFPRPQKTTSTLSNEELRILRREAGHEETSYRNDCLEDWIIQDIGLLINTLPALAVEERTERAQLLWESLCHLEERRRGVFEGEYKWTHNGSYTKKFPSTFLRQLNETSWVPDRDGKLQPPGLVIFDTLEWKNNPFLLSKITFKPPLLDQLAKEAGIEPAILDSLKKFGITTVADLTSRLGFTEPASKPADKLEPALLYDQDVYGDAKDLYGDLPDIPPGIPDTDGDGFIRSNSRNVISNQQLKVDGDSRGVNYIATDYLSYSSKKVGGNWKGSINSSKRPPGSNGGRPFISYVGVHTNDEESDPDGLDQIARMKLEELAIQQILAVEPKLKRAAAFNPGFDLVEEGSDGQPIRWVEVKAMTGTLHDRPVGISSTQFECARLHGAAFWLYVVEKVSSPEGTRILRIQDPAGHVRTFTFDHGWVHITKTEFV